jgi:hypothetical protein
MYLKNKFKTKKLGVNFNNSCIVFVVFMLVLLTLSFSVIPSMTYAKSPYESGYDHGCDDADISDPSDRYINQPEKGPAFHTSKFMNGYNSGFSSCSADSNDDDNYNSPRNNVNSNNNNYNSPRNNVNNEQVPSRSTDMSPEMRAELDAMWKQKFKEWDEMKNCTLKNMIANLGDGSGSRC